MISLAFDGLPHEFTRLRAGSLYWLACADASQADLIAAGVLAGADDVRMAVAASLGRTPASMLEPLRPGQGPARVRLHQAGASQVEAALRDLPIDLPRCADGQGVLCVVQLPAAAMDTLDDRQLPRWCRQLQDWASAGGHCVLLLCHGESATLAPRLLPLNRLCGGIAQLHPHRGALRLMVHYWSNAEGVVAQHEFDAEWRGTRLHVVANSNAGMQALLEEGGDRFLYLAQADALEGAPPLSPAWRLFDGWPALVASAQHAQAATIVLAIRENNDVDGLARIVYRLRSERGNGLKLVVREMSPCLRYADERLLLDAGASLVAPAGIPLARFLTLLETIQGQPWQGRLHDDVERLIRRHRPPAIGGIVSAARFRQAASELLEQQDGAVESAALVLQPVAGVNAAQALQQLHMRRRGDFACLYGGQVWLFLFACRSEGVERALDNLFRLPWQEVFDGYQRLAAYDVMAMNANAETGAPVASAPVMVASANAAIPALSPQPLRLGEAP